MIDTDVSGDLVDPFLRRAAKINEPDWVELASICLDRSTLRGCAISLVLTLDTPDKDLVTKALDRLDDHSKLVKILCLRNQIPEYLVGQLLHHENATIATAAAHGEWATEPEGSVRDSLRESWQDVVINRADDDYWLGRVLKDNSSLAYKWLQACIKERESTSLMYGDTVIDAVNPLSTEERQHILCQIPETYTMARLVACLINDTSLYYELLSNKQLKSLHLVPLSGYREEVRSKGDGVKVEPEGLWTEKAKLALDAGYSVEEIVGAVYGYTMMSIVWSREESARRAAWVEWFERLCSDEDERIREIGKVGKADAEAAQQRALASERQEAIYGI